MMAAEISRTLGAAAVAASFLLGALSAMPAAAQTVYAFEAEEDKGPWQEAEVSFPAPPQLEKLLPLKTEANAGMRFAVDPEALAIGSDGVVRYTVVATSAGGARNVSYEGIRCKTFERRVYGYNHKDSWNKSRNSKWERIVRGERNGYADTLALDFFCQSTTQVGTVDEIIARIRKNEVLNPRIQY
jgi:hypothetical protein